IPGVRYLLDPLRRSRTAFDFLRAAPLAALREGRPVRVIVSADRWDAYTHYPPGPIGSVWLIREQDDGDAPKVRCLQTICPHLGCGIDYVADRNAFVCPCHASEFEPGGRRRFGPSPRDMDELQCRITGPTDSHERWVEVRYAEFQTGKTAKQPLT
ncbi:MAG: Rieske 2Fe-2S domain-containing protein, partial [Planctomycetes bacterium]|nr:Rieske 2Fe-2S domain-containing protein [Planctomycetota bacterium]